MTINEFTKIKDLDISDEFVTVSSEVLGKEIAIHLNSLGESGSVLITNDKREVIGFITNSELVSHLAKGNNPLEMTAANLMNIDFIEVIEDDTIGNFLNKLPKEYPKAVVVIDYDLCCVGFLSKSDYQTALSQLNKK